MKNPDLVITHGGCWDGLVAAWAVVENTGCRDIVFANHGQDPPDVQGRRVMLVDFAYPRDALLRMHEAAEELTVHDHHATTEDDLRGLPFAFFDLAKSGARLAWEATSNAGAPWIVDYVEDADLWRFALPRSRGVRAFYKSFPMDIDAVDDIVSAFSPETAADLGEPILRADAQHVRTMCDAAFRIELLGYRGHAAWAPILFADVREALLDEYPDDNIGVSIRRRPDGRIELGIGSRKGGPNCGEIAKQYGGGGHPGAAGFVAKTDHGRLLGLGFELAGDADAKAT